MLPMAPMRFVAVLVLGLVVVPTLSGQETKEAIADAWRKRQDRTKSAIIEWTEDQTDMAGCISYYCRHLKGEVPPKDTTFSGKSSVWFDEKKLRYEYTSKDWSVKLSTYEPIHYLCAFNGSICSHLHGPDSEREWHQGQIRTENSHIHHANWNLQPILMTYRAMVASMRAFDLSIFQLTGNKAIVDNHLCLELYQGAAGVPENRIYVDPSRGYLILRYTTIHGGVMKHKLDVRYKSMGDDWVPDTWRLVDNNPKGALERSYSATVTSAQLNPAIAADEFELVFPVGTRVRDEKNGTDWIVKEDAQKRMIPHSEASLPYAVLAGTNPPLAPWALLGGPRRWPIVAGVALALLTLGIFVLRVRQRGKRGPS